MADNIKRVTLGSILIDTDRDVWATMLNKSYLETIENLEEIIKSVVSLTDLSSVEKIGEISFVARVSVLIDFDNGIVFQDSFHLELFPIEDEEVNSAVREMGYSMVSDEINLKLLSYFTGRDISEISL